MPPVDLGDPYADYGRDRLKAFLAGYALLRDPDVQPTNTPTLASARLAIHALILHHGGVDRRAPCTDTATAADGARGVPLDPAVLRGYVGRYTLAPGVEFAITIEQGQLYAQLTGQPAYPVYAAAADHFFYTVADARLDFERDAGGRIVALALHQNGRDQRAPRER